MQFKKDDSADFSAKSNRQRKESASILANAAEQKKTEKVAAAKAVTEKAAAAKSLSRRGAMRDSIKKVKSQKALENLIDRDMGSSIDPKTGKLSILTGWAGQKERSLLRSGKASEDKITKGAANALEGFGKLGFREGATGARGVLNKAVGRTATGKVARTLGLLGTVGVVGGVGKAGVDKLRNRN